MEELSATYQQYIRAGHGFYLVYSITDRRSFQALDRIRDDILRVKETDFVPMVLCGNKCDLNDDRAVSAAEGEQLATSWGCPFFETSAKTFVNLEVHSCNVFVDADDERLPSQDW